MKDEQKRHGATAGGVASGAYGQVNKSFDEERFHAAQGHGFAAERANTLYDRVTGHDAKIVGDDNVKNGADRIVDGVMIQSKYCQTGKQCINECFDKEGNFRYWNNGKPMQIEVPSDKFDAAVQAMEEKIQQGKVPGITDPKEAKNIVRKGHFTYEQAKNIAKAGTVESLSYDAVNGVVIATSAFGVTAIITLATSLWSGEGFEKSLKLATYSGLKVGGTAFITTVLAGQLSKAGLNSALVGSSEAVVALMGPKASAVLINAFRNGNNIYGAAAMKSAAKLLRGNAITAGLTMVVLFFEELATDYLLSQREAKEAVDKLSKKLDGKKLKDMYASKDRKKHARNLLVPIIEGVTKKRKHIAAVSDDQMAMSLKEVLEDISNSAEYTNGAAAVY